MRLKSIPNSRIRPIRLIGLCVSLITFLYPPVLRIQFDPSTAKSQFVECLRWLPYENINFYLGIDGISLFFVILTTFLIPICILVGWSGMRSYGKEYITASLICEFLMIAANSLVRRGVLQNKFGLALSLLLRPIQQRTLGPWNSFSS